MSRIYKTGTSDTLNLGTGFGSNNTLTICAWIKTYVEDATTRYIISHDNINGNIGTYWLAKTNGSGTQTLTFLCRSITLTGVKIINQDQWYHVAAVASSTGMAIYVNGILDASNVTNSSLISTSSQTDIGSQNNAATGPWKGQISHFYLYTAKRFNQVDITQNYLCRGNMRKGTPSFWAMDETSPAVDLGLNVKKGTYTGTVYSPEEPGLVSARRFHVLRESGYRYFPKRWRRRNITQQAVAGGLSIPAAMYDYRRRRIHS